MKDWQTYIDNGERRLEESNTAIKRIDEAAKQSSLPCEVLDDLHCQQHLATYLFFQLQQAPQTDWLLYREAFKCTEGKVKRAIQEASDVLANR